MIASSPTTIVIPTYNAKELLTANLPSVEAILRPGDELLIVEDGGTDDTVQSLVERYHAVLQSSKPSAQDESYLLYEGSVNVGKGVVPVQVMLLNTNLRFAGAVNAAVQRVRTPLFFLLNNDVEPSAGILDVLTTFFEDATTFGVGCLEYENADKSVVGGKNILSFNRGIFQHARATEFTTGETAWVSGGSGIFDTNKWKLLGGFDPKFYPAYWEDNDISFRARKRGWKTIFCAQAIVFHQHETSNESVFGQAQIRNLSWHHQNYFTRKHASFSQLLQYVLWQPYWWWKMRA
ncbi:glycosyltransferase [Candidatus Woesebacteria bacterium]|nr:glycosyltransferase [Candidatus Woesebacteria bacterium]